MIDRSNTRDTPSHPAVFDTDRLFGTRVAKPILASGHMRLQQKAGHMIASDPIPHCINSCEAGAVHIWMAGSVAGHGEVGDSRAYSAAMGWAAGILARRGRMDRSS